MLATADLFILIYSYEDDSRGWFSSSVTPHLLSLGGEMGETVLLIIANIPQLVLSLNYMFLNQVITCMAASREWSLFAHQRKGLRTSQPRGSQRSTYWLQIPLKYSVPLMISSAALHYLASQCLFFGSVKYYSYKAEAVELEGYTGLGYSRDAIQLFMAIFIIPLAAAVAWGGSREKPGIPPAGLCSLAISAACHPPAGEKDAHLQLVQWGEIPRERLDEIRHCSFSSGEVVLPAEGRKYA